jgi:hypothetical protein
MVHMVGTNSMGKVEEVEVEIEPGQSVEAIVDAEQQYRLVYAFWQQQRRTTLSRDRYDRAREKGKTHNNQQLTPCLVDYRRRRQ